MRMYQAANNRCGKLIGDGTKLTRHPKTTGIVCSPSTAETRRIAKLTAALWPSPYDTEMMLIAAEWANMFFGGSPAFPRICYK